MRAVVGELRPEITLKCVSNNLSISISALLRSPLYAHITIYIEYHVVFAYWNIGVATVAVFHKNLVNLFAALLDMGAVVQVSHLSWKN